MSKKQYFNVTLTFAQKITDDETIIAIAKAIAEAIKHECHTRGIVPDYADTYTETISVSPQFLPEGKVELNVIE